MSREARLVFEAMGTRCELAGRGRAAGRLPLGRAWIDSVAGRLTRFHPDSELMRLNARAGRGWTPVSPALEAVLTAALQAWEASSGLVHAGVLECMVAIGYGRPLVEGQTPLLTRPAPPPPLPEMLAIRPAAARLARGTALDLGGIAKGWMADTLADLLGDDCVVNLGGDLFARGRWTVGFGREAVVLDGLGAATSGSWRRRWGDGLHHVIDPRTAAPATGDLCQVSVIASSASVAETLAKAALIQGRAAGQAWLRGRALGYAFA